MLALELIAWWYHRGWQQIIRNCGQRLLKVSHMFSVPILLRTWLAPWRRIVTYPGASLDAKLRAMGDNLVSRAVGFSVRTVVLLTALIALMLTALLNVAQIVSWPLIPPLIVVFLVKAVTG